MSKQKFKKIRILKSGVKVKGLKVQDILNVDIKTFNKLSESDLRKLTSRLVSAGNKRLRNFIKKGITSPATRYIEQSGGMFSVKGLSLNQLRAEFMRIKSFFGAETSTQKGWERVKTETIKKLNEKGVSVNADNFDSLWQAYEKIKELDPSVSEQRLKYKVLDETAEMLDSGSSVDNVVNDITERISDIYEEQEQWGTGTAAFYEL